jgi:hypothetical protein
LAYDLEYSPLPAFFFALSVASTFAFTLSYEGAFTDAFLADLSSLSSSIGSITNSTKSSRPTSLIILSRPSSLIPAAKKSAQASRLYKAQANKRLNREETEIIDDLVESGLFSDEEIKAILDLEEE